MEGGDEKGLARISIPFPTRLYPLSFDWVVQQERLSNVAIVVQRFLNAKAIQRC